jgi:GH3 auxin-responsive promoter
MRLLIRGFGLLLAPIARRFDRALQQPEIAQAKVQREIVDRLAKSEYGRSLGVKSVADWEKVPIVTYDDLPDLDQLTTEPILFYEQTSGSRGAAKLIPYTKSLRRSFSQMFCVWAYDLIQHVPFTTGKVYFCISPKLGPVSELVVDRVGSDPPKSPLKRGTLTSLVPPFLRGARGDRGNRDDRQPNALQTDADYLDSWLTWILSPFLVTLPDAQTIQNPEEFKAKLSLKLLQEEKLEIISVWNPSFLKVILDYISTNREQLQRDLPPHRSHLLNHPEIPWPQLWPQLKLISCWDAAGAIEQARVLRSLFPDVLIQGKGLLATEAPMTVPLMAARGCVPVLDEVFFEFEDLEQRFWRLHELAIGQEYQIILSQKGGLYRYRIGDRICVTHYYYQTPCLEFLGRSGGISDLVGEKLNPDFVRDVLQRLDLPAGFKTLVPLTNPAHYVLLLDTEVEAGLTKKLEALLCQSYHYQHARSLGQLQAVAVIGRSDMAEQWAKLRMQNGARWGDIKDEILVSQPIGRIDRFYSASSKPTT